MGARSARPLTIGVLGTVATTMPVFLALALAVLISQDLGFGLVGIGSLASAFFGAMAVSSLVLGRVADILGGTLSMRVATVGTAVIAAAIAIFANEIVGLLILLALAGIAAALGQPASNRLLMNGVPPDRLGIAFGLKQSAPPVASALAGLSVPLIGLTIGWRWAFVIAAVLSAVIAIGVGPQASAENGRGFGGGHGRLPRLQGRSVLVLLAVGFALAWATSSVILAFYVEAAVRSGSSPGVAGVVLAMANAAAIATRLVAGAACDRYSLVPLYLASGLLMAGTFGLALLATERPGLMTVGVVVALSGAWGFPGVFWFALVSAYPEAPGRVTGAITPGAIGGIAGPIGFGLVVSNLGYSLGWWIAAITSLLAAITMLVGARRLPTPAAVAE
jgi:MFS family permease